MTGSVLKVDDVGKRFAGRTVVEDVSFVLEPGERVALLGHNGAGKTTLFKMILGFLEPDRGRIDVLGTGPGSLKARRGTAFLPETVAFQPTLTGEEVLRYLARLKGADPDATAGLLRRVDLAEAGPRRIGTYSRGMRQRLGLAQALIGRPRLLLLDEPTGGLDPVSRQNFYRIVEQVAETGATVLWSSHALTEIEARTDRILILSHGRMVADNTLARLRQEARLPIRLTVHGPAEAADDTAARLGGRRINGRSVELLCSQDEKLARLAAIAALGAAVEDVEVQPPSLDEIYRHFTAGPEQGSPPC